MGEKLSIFKSFRRQQISLRLVSLFAHLSLHNNIWNYCASTIYNNDCMVFKFGDIYLHSAASFVSAVDLDSTKILLTNEASFCNFKRLVLLA